jgi:DNA-binding SARP family transcriptional activator
MRVHTDPTSVPLRVQLLGGFRLVVGSEPVDDGAWRLRKPRDLLELLALAPGHRLHTEQILDALWPGADVAAASNQLRKALHHTRRIAGADAVVRHGELLALDAGVEVDVDVFEAAVAVARRSRDPADLAAAVAAYGGELLPEDRYEDWVGPRRQQLALDHVGVLTELAASLEARGDLDGSADALHRVLAVDPAAEAAHVALMRLHALAGRRGDALRQYERLQAVLRRDLDVEPDVATQRLHEEIRSGRPLDADLTTQLWEDIGDLRLLSGDAVGAAQAFSSAAATVDGPRLHRKAAEAHLIEHDVAGAAAHVRRAEALLATNDDRAELGRFLGVRANWHWDAGRTDDALADAEASLKIAEASGDTADVAAAHQRLAIVFHFRGRWREGLEEEIERLGTAMDDEPALSRTFDIHHCIGQYHLYGDRLHGDVEAYARRTLAVATRWRARRAEAFAWCLLGESLLLGGSWDEASACLDRSITLYDDLGSVTVPLPWQRRAELAACRGGSEAVRVDLQRAAAIATVSPMGRHGWGRIYATAALDALERDEPAEAVRAVASAAAAAARHGDCPSCSALLNPLAAEAAAAVGDAAGARAAATAAEAVAATFESAAWRAMAETAAGWSDVVAGDEAAGRGRFLAAAAFYDDARQPFWAARARAHAGDVVAAAEAFTRLGATRAAARARRRGTPGERRPSIVGP